MMSTKRQTILRKSVIKIIIYLTTFYLLAVIGGCLMADRIIFHPRPASYRDSDTIIKLPVTETEKIAAVYLRSPTAKFTILYSHGNAEDLGGVFPTLKLFKQHGFSVMAYDYRGYGLSDGKPSEINVYQDAAVALHYLTDKLKIPKNRIIIFGRSLGTGPSVELAAKEPVAGLILQSPFTSTFRVMTKVKLLPFDKFDNIAKIARVKCPVMIIHGQQDHVIPFTHGKTLYNAANKPKIFFPVPEAGHNSVQLFAGEAYWQQIKQFTELINDSKN
ncbi:MAG: alpha/beta hydrolase [Victivallaceae bacterium]|nr:alpha/beta hydrolase [Victivallaceae bacterium]